MSNSKPSISNRKFWIIAGLTLALSSALVVSVIPQIGLFRAWEARQLVGKAQIASGAEAEADYKLAYRLDSSNAVAALHFAEIQTNKGNPAEALAILVRVNGGREVERARIRAALEAGKMDIALAASDRLLELKPADDDIVLAAIAYGMNNDTARATALEPLVTSPEVLQAVRRATADKLALASLLADRGLLISASGLLVKTPNSVARALLMGRILVDQNTEASLEAAVDYYTSGIIMDPANSVLRNELIATLRKLKRNVEADSQQVLLERLVAGKP